MPSYSVSVTNTSITLSATTESPYNYLKAFCRLASEDASTSKTSGYVTSKYNFTFSGLSPGTDYVVNLAYNTTDSWGSAAGWAGAEAVTTSGTAAVTTYIAYVEYDANGGSGAPSKQTFTQASSNEISCTLSSTIPTRSAYSFLGWSTSSTATSATYSAGETITLYGTTAGATCKLYAVWEANDYGTANLILGSGIASVEYARLDYDLVRYPTTANTYYTATEDKSFSSCNKLYIGNITLSEGYTLPWSASYSGTYGSDTTTDRTEGSTYLVNASLYPSSGKNATIVLSATKEVVYHTVTINYYSTGGTKIGTQAYNVEDGTTITFSDSTYAIDITGYSYSGAKNSSGASVTSATITYDATYNLYYAPVEYTVTLYHYTGGVLYTTSTVTVEYNDKITFSNQAKSIGGYTYDHAEGSSGITLTSATITGNETYYLYYTLNSHTVTLTYVTAAGATIGSRSHSIKYGTTITFSDSTYSEDIVGYDYDYATDSSGTVVTAATITDDVAFTLYYKARTYTVTLVHITGSTPYTESTVYVTYGGTITFEKNKHTIAGYTYDHAESSSGITLTSATITGNETYYLYYTLNSHTVTLTYVTAAGATIGSRSHSIKYGTTITFSDSTYSEDIVGYDYDYATDSSGTVVTAATITDDVAFTLYYKARTYTVTLVHITGSTPYTESTVYVTYGGTITFEKNKHTIAGYTYDHAESSSGITLTSATITGNETYYLYYTLNSYDITFTYYSTHTGEKIGSRKLSIKHGTSIEFATDTTYIEIPTGYTYSSATDSDGNSVIGVNVSEPASFNIYCTPIEYEVTLYHYTGSVLKDTTTVKQKYYQYVTFSEHTITYDGYTYDHTENTAGTTLEKAQVTGAGQKYNLYYTLNYIVNVSYELNGGDSGPKASIESIPQKATEYWYTVLENPTREGYDFLGWDLDVTSKEEAYVAGDQINLALYASSDETTVTFVAKWGLVVILSYNANGGDGAPAEQKATIVPPAETYLFTISADAPLRTDYEFLGWSTDKDAKEHSYSPNDEIEIGESTTLYAIWKRLTGYAFIWDGSEWGRYEVYIYDGSGWNRYEPQFYASDWTETTL